jgi:competence protein ComEA
LLQFAGGLIRALEKISQKIGFTKTETKVILFILLALFAGLIVNAIKKSKNNNDYLEFNYKTEDSLFNAALSNFRLRDSLSLPKGNKIDQQQEVSDFNKGKVIQRNNKKVIPASKSININSAAISELILLPGIGQKTAEAIIEYRNKHIKFTSLDEILKVKGIGVKKLDKIKMFICIE